MVGPASVRCLDAKGKSRKDLLNDLGKRHTLQLLKRPSNEGIAGNPAFGNLKKWPERIAWYHSTGVCEDGYSDVYSNCPERVKAL
jgi:hypothetical protein